MNLPDRLRYVNEREIGIQRLSNAEGDFEFRDVNGKRVTNKKTLHRINKLALPPAWQDVWICPDENGHLQATGKDQRGRLQYRYHEKWTEFRQHKKFEKLLHFGNSLPILRRKVLKDLQQPTFTYTKTLALAVKLLDCNYLRVGSDFYLNRNETYGLTTLRRKHLQEAKDHLLLSYQAKSGKQRRIKVDNPTVVRLLKEANELPGYEIFRYHDGSQLNVIHSEDVNGYLQSITSSDISAKDFRTWAGTKLCVEEYEMATQDVANGVRKKLETALVSRVAKKLGNTVSTARNYYIHPDVLKYVLNGGSSLMIQTHEGIKSETMLSASEEIVLKLLELNSA